MDKIIQKILNKSKDHENLFLTESDCQYYVRSIIEAEIVNKNIMEDGKNNISIEFPIIRSELSWYNNNSRNKKLTIRPDLTIISQEKLVLYKPKSFNISKGFNFNGNALNIEIKFIRRNSSFEKNIIKGIEKDKNNAMLLYKRFEECSIKIWTHILIFIWSEKACNQVEENETIQDLLSNDAGFTFHIIKKKF